MRYAITAGILAALIGAGLARADVVENFNVEDWSGMAYADDATGKIANCSVYAANQKGGTLFFIKNSDGTWFFSLTDQSWKLTPSTEYPVRYKIDARRTVSTDALALSETQLGIYMQNDDPFFGQVRRGNRLTFTFEDESYSFDLADSGKALDAAQACLERHQNSDAQAAEASGGNAQPAPEDTPASAEEPPPGLEKEPETAQAASPLPLPPLGETSIETIEVPGWEAAAFASDGKFTHCAIRAEYENGATLAVALAADRSLVLAVYHDDWAPQPDKRHPFSYSYRGDGGPVEVNAEAEALGPNLLAVNMGSDSATFRDLSAAPEIVIEAEGKTLTFNITDIGPGMEAMERCREKHGAAAQSSSSSKKKPPASKKVSQVPASDQPQELAAADDKATDTESGAEPPSGAEAGTGDIKVEAADFTKSLLSRSGYANLTMLTGDDVPESMRSRASAWQIGEIMGVTDVVDASMAELRQQLESTDRKDCAGTFTHEVTSEADGGAHVFTNCRSPALNLDIHYVIVPREGQGYYLLSFIAFAPGTAVGSIASKVFETARAT